MKHQTTRGYMEVKKLSEKGRNVERYGNAASRKEGIVTPFYKKKQSSTLQMNNSYEYRMQRLQRNTGIKNEKIS